MEFVLTDQTVYGSVAMQSSTDTTRTQLYKEMTAMLLRHSVANRMINEFDNNINSDLNGLSCQLRQYYVSLLPNCLLSAWPNG